MRPRAHWFARDLAAFVLTRRAFCLGRTSQRAPRANADRSETSIGKNS